MRRWTDDELNAIYDRTSGKCHLCHKKLAWSNYGKPRKRAPWHVDHSVPLARRGADDLRNTYAACISCNCSKQDGTNRSLRSSNGVKRAPLSVAKRREARIWNGAGGAGVGALIGGALGGRAGAWIGGAIGAALGVNANPDKLH